MKRKHNPDCKKASASDKKNAPVAGVNNNQAKKQQEPSGKNQHHHP